MSVHGEDVTATEGEPVVRDARGRTPEECWEAGDVFLFRGGTLDGEPLPPEDRDEAGREAHAAVIAESLRRGAIVRSQEDW